MAMTYIEKIGYLMAMKVQPRKVKSERRGEWNSSEVKVSNGEI